MRGELTKSIQEDVPWYMDYANDVGIEDETRSGVNAQLEILQGTLNLKAFLSFNRTKTEYMEYKFNKNRNINKGTIRLDGQWILKRENFRYLQLIIHKNREIERMSIIG